jgi:hypothetical protein
MSRQGAKSAKVAEGGSVSGFVSPVFSQLGELGTLGALAPYTPFFPAGR